ncbi:MAG: homoprotocatechuate degradation operon regulator HpaR [Pseudomonadota bacterium]
MKHQPIPDGYVPVRQSLPVALTRARESVLSYWRPVLTERGFTEQQWRVLRVVNEYEPIDISTLAGFAALHMPSVTRILQALEKGGYLSRERDTKDSRRSWVRVTQKTRDIMYAEGAKSSEIMRQIEERFGAENLQELSRLLNELADIRLSHD